MGEERAGPTAAVRAWMRAGRAGLRAAWRPILGYQAAAHALQAAALAPLALWLVYRTMAWTGGPVAANYDVVARALRPSALVVLAVGAFALTVLATLRVGGLAVVTAEAAAGRRPTVAGAFGRVAAALPRLRGGGALLRSLLFVAVVAPAAAAGAGVLARLCLLRFPDSVALRLFPLPTVAVAALVAGAALLAVASLLLHVRWLFVPHAVCVEGLDLGAAFARSVALTRGRGRPLAALVVALYAADAVALAAASGLLTAVTGAVLARVHATEPLFVALAALLLVVDALVLLVLHGAVVGWALASVTAAWRDASGRRDVSVPGAAAPVRTTRRLVLAAIALVALATAAAVPAVRGAVADADRTVLVSAHRGSSRRAPENTRAAIEAAIEDGADQVEIDVLLSADGVPVVVHDLTLARVAGLDRRVDSMTAAELGATDVGSWFGPAFAGETVPTLDEVLAQVAGRADLLVEIKVEAGRDGLAEAVVGALRRHGALGTCPIQSLDAAVLAAVEALAPEASTGLVVTAAVGDVLAVPVDFYSVQPLMATTGFVSRAHARGRGVWVWTLNEERDIRGAVDRGVDALITDEPARARAILDARTPADDLRAALMRLFGR